MYRYTWYYLVYITFFVRIMASTFTEMSTKLFKVDPRFPTNIMFRENVTFVFVTIPSFFFVFVRNGPK